MLLSSIFSWVLAATLRASLLVLVTLLLQRLLRSRLTAKWKYAIWTPVLVAILIPAQPLLPHLEWPVASESRTASNVDSASNAVAIVGSPEVDSGLDPLAAPSHSNINAVQPDEQLRASAADISSATPANSEVQATSGEDAEVAFTNVGESERFTASSQSWNWRSVLAFGWLLGAVCLSIVVWISYARALRRIRRRAIPVEQDDLARVQSLAKELGLRRTPRVWLSPEVKAPAVCGALRPMLLLNDDFFHMLSCDEADFVLRHELMHIRRGDVLLNTILFGLLSLHWFNPLLWFAFFRAGADREAACDEDVLHTESPARRVAYGKTLLRLEAVLPQSGVCLGFVGMVQKGKRLRERIQFISNPKRMGLSMKSLVLLCMCVTAILGIAKSAEPQLKPKTQQSTLATDERRTEESKGETPQQEPLKFRKVTSLESPGKELTLARVSVSLDQESVIARVLSGDRGGTNGGVQFRRYDVVLQNLDPESPKRTSLGDHYFGFVPKSNLAFVVRWGAGVRFWNTVSHAPSGDYMPHELREDTTILPAVSPDGKVMVTRSQLNHLQFWNIETRQPITEEIEQRGLVSSMRFSADGKWFFSRAPGGLSVRDPQTGDLVVGDVRHDAISYAYSSDTKQLLTVESSHDEEDGWRSDLVIRSGKTFAERRRVQVAGKARSVEWIDNSHVLIVGRNPALPPSSNERETLYVVSLADDKADVRVLMRYNWIRDAVVAPDRKHFITRTREQTSCWRVGEREPVWTKPGDHLVAYGDRGWVLFHNGPVVAYSLLDGSELWRGEDVRLCKVFGSKIWTCNDDKMEIWQVEPGTGPPKPGDQPAQPKRSNAAVRSPTYVPAPDERLLKEKNVGDSTEQLWRFLKDPALPPWEPPLEEWLGHFDKRAAWDAEITMYRLKARGMKRVQPGRSGSRPPRIRPGAESTFSQRSMPSRHHGSWRRRFACCIIENLPTSRLSLSTLPPRSSGSTRKLRYTLVSVLAATARENEGPAAELVAATQSPTAIVRALATRSLIRAGEIEPAAAARLCENETPGVRWEIAMGLVDCHAKEAIPILIDLIPDVQRQQAAHLQRLLRHISGNGPAEQQSDEKRFRSTIPGGVVGMVE